MAGKGPAAAAMSVAGRLCEVAGVHACYSCVLYLLPVVHRAGKSEGVGGGEGRLAAPTAIVLLFFG